METDTMVRCDHCTEEVFSVWRFRERDEEMTHHSPSWVCADCHPELIGAARDRQTNEQLRADARESAAQATDVDAGDRAMTDGGRTR